jgi:hypothetical protein
MPHALPTLSALRTILLAAAVAAPLLACTQTPDAIMSGSSVSPAQSTASASSGAVDYENYAAY